MPGDLPAKGHKRLPLAAVASVRKLVHSRTYSSLMSPASAEQDVSPVLLLLRIGKVQQRRQPGLRLERILEMIQCQLVGTNPARSSDPSPNDSLSLPACCRKRNFVSRTRSPDRDQAYRGPVGGSRPSAVTLGTASRHAQRGKALRWLASGRQPRSRPFQLRGAVPVQRHEGNPSRTSLYVASGSDHEPCEGAPVKR